jgi:hypothetical protein
MGVAEVVHHDVKCGKEGVHIDHKSSVPFPWGSGSKPTLVCGRLPLKSSTGNSHQAFKRVRIFEVQPLKNDLHTIFLALVPLVYDAGHFEMLALKVG